METIIIAFFVAIVALTTVVNYNETKVKIEKEKTEQEYIRKMDKEDVRATFGGADDESN